MTPWLGAGWFTRACMGLRCRAKEVTKTMGKYRVPRVTVRMCEEKIAELEEENECLRRQLDNGALHLNAQEVLQVAHAFGGLTDYIKRHVCPAHRQEAVRAIMGGTMVINWFSEAVAQTFTPDEFDEAETKLEAERIASELTEAPFNGVFN